VMRALPHSGMIWYITVARKRKEIRDARDA
jgi:hypothetical protein